MLIVEIGRVLSVKFQLLCVFLKVYKKILDYHDFRYQYSSVPSIFVEDKFTETEVRRFYYRRINVPLKMNLSYT